MMPASAKIPWLICYDIADPSRLQRVHKIVSGYAEPFQYSVFRKVTNRRDVIQLMERVEPIINAQSDDIRAYSLLTSGRHTVYGASNLPGGVLFFD